MLRRNSSSPFTHAVVLDFEATCDDQNPPRPQEIIEFPSVLLSLEDLRIEDEFSSFVKPVHHPVLTPFCTELTSIVQDDVNEAPVFAEVLEDHSAWLESHGLTAENAIVVTCGDWDFKHMLPAQCAVAEPEVTRLKPIYTRWVNLKNLYCQATLKKKAPGMKGMLKHLGLPLVGRHHRGIDDCRNIASILRHLLFQGVRLEATGELGISSHPPVKLVLCAEGRKEKVRLKHRRIQTLHRLIGSVFKKPAVQIQRLNGQVLQEDEDLTLLLSGEEIKLKF